MKFRPLLITLILLGSLFVIPGQAASPSPNLTFQLPASGDWIIGPGESITIEGETIELKGNLTVERGGSLTLRDGAKLIINSSYSGQYRIIVEEGGNFNVIDSEVTGLEKEYTGKIEYNLKKGMNYISIPFKRTNDSVESVLSPLKGRYYKAYIYDSSDSGDPWKFYSPGMDKNHSDEMPSYVWKFSTENTLEDTIPPTIKFTLPENNTTCEGNQNVLVVFDESMDTSTVPRIEKLKGFVIDNFHFLGWSTTFVENDTAIWAHDPWANGDNIILKISAYRDLSGNAGENYTFSFYVTNSIDPGVNETSPRDGESNVPIDSNLYVIFDKSINSSSEPEVLVMAGNDTSGWNFLGWSTTNVENDTAIWTHNPWRERDTIIIRISNYTDTFGNTGPNHYIYFSTRDVTPPSIKDTYPIEGDSFVQIDSLIYVIFNESMNTTAKPLISQTGGTDPGNWTFLGWRSTYLQNDTVVWSHDPWSGFENITLTIYNYTDLSGNLGTAYSWTFRTGDDRTPRVKEIYPDTFQKVPVSAEVRVVFDSSMNVDVVPEITRADGNTSANWSFLGWESTYVPHDTAVWAHDDWSSETNITLRISNYSDLSKISPYQGIFVYLYDNYSFELSGSVESSISSQLYAGWNSVGYPFLDNSTVEEVFSSISASYDMIKTYSGENETYLNRTDVLEAGKAYWIHATEDCLWFVSAYSLLDLDSIFPKFGWRYENGSSGNIQNSIISGCGFSGENFQGLSIFSDLVKMGNSEIKNGYAGVYIEDSSPILSNNDIHTTHYGIISKNASPILSQNNIYNNREGGILVRSGFPIISSNTVSFNTGSGIYIYDSTSILDSNTLNSNIGSGVYISGSNVSVYSSYMKYNKKGLYSESSEVLLYGSTISNNEIGVHAVESEIDIRENDFSLNKYDISAENGTSGRIENNSMSSSERAHISCKNMSSPRIYGNILISGDSGIYVARSVPLIEKNIIGQNRGSGIHLQDGGDSRIRNNVITNNGWAGVYVDGSNPIIENNTLSYNDFGIASFNASSQIRNNTVVKNKWYGLSFVYSKAEVENTELLTNKWYGILTSYSTFTLRNTTIKNSTYQLYLTHNSRGRAINSTISQEKTHLDMSSILYVEYFLNIYARDSLGNWINNASYTIRSAGGETVEEGYTAYGKAELIPLRSYVRTFGGITDVDNPYELIVSWGSETFNRTFSMNSTIREEFSFNPVEYSIYEDSGEVGLFNIYDWLPPEENSTFIINGSFYLRGSVEGGIFYINPVKDWSGSEEITIVEKVENRTVGEYRFVVHVMQINDAPRLEGENPTYSSEKYTVFRITYVDPENDLPEFMRVVINGKAHDMIPENPRDLNVVDGKTYIYRAELNDGEYTYYFICSDGKNISSTEEMELTVKKPFSMPMWAIYLLLSLGILVVLYVSIRIRRLKKMAGEDVEFTIPRSEKKPSEIVSPLTARRRVWGRKSPGLDTKDTGIDSARMGSSSIIDRNAGEEPVVEPEGGTTVTDSVETAGEVTVPVALAAGSEESEKEPGEKRTKYGTAKFMEIQRKHRKLRVLLEDKEKYAKLEPMVENEDISGSAEESVDEILKSIKGED